MDKQFFVYMVTNKNNYAIYTEVTNNLIRRIYKHKKNINFSLQNQEKSYIYKVIKVKK